MGAWLELFTRLVDAGHVPERGIDQLDQLALAAVLARNPEGVATLPDPYNYRLTRRPDLKRPARKLDLADLVHVHYMKAFYVPGFLEAVRPPLRVDTPQFEWLAAGLPLRAGDRGAQTGGRLGAELAGHPPGGARSAGAPAVRRPAAGVRVIAIFGPTAVGKTAVAIAVADLLRARGEDPVAVSCDAIQVYRGLEVLSGAAVRAERERLEHRLVGVAALDEECSAGHFAALAHAEIDALLAAGRRPLVVGGTGLYLRAALAELELRPPVPSDVRDRGRARARRAGKEALHAELPPEVARSRAPPTTASESPASRVCARAGIDPPAGSDGLWTASLRVPTALFGLVIDRDALASAMDARAAAAIVEAGAAAEVTRGRRERRLAHRARRTRLRGPARRAARGARRPHRAYARRQLTWMRQMERVDADRPDRADRREDVAAEIVTPRRGK